LMPSPLASRAWINRPFTPRQTNAPVPGLKPKTLLPWTSFPDLERYQGIRDRNPGHA
jgi:hypothetical protein